ncbi:hypothetical protein AB0G02_40990, partial [Actinosynnema sp. NPDC023658]
TGSAVLVDEATPACSLMHSLAYQLIAAGAVAPDRLRVVSGVPCPAPVNPGLQALLAPDVPDVVDAALAALGAPARRGPALTKGSV